MWKSVSHDIEDNVDAPMHLIFLGIVKSTMGYVHEFFKQSNLNRSFTKIMSHKMRCLDSTYKLNWMKIIPFRNTASMLDSTGWVSENFVSFSRIFLWYISPISSLQIGPILDNTRTKDNLHDWSLIQLKRYTQLHSIVVVKPNMNRKIPTKIEYRCAIIDFWKNNPTIHNVVDDDISDPFFCTVEDVILLVQFLHKLIFTLMHQNNNHVTITRNKIEKFVRLYIFQLYKITSYLSIKDVHLRLWNVQSLLNLGSTFERFGYFNTFWEGSTSGEAIIKFLKRESSCTSSANWSYHMLLRYYKRRSLELCNPLSMITPSHPKKQYHVYKSIDEFTSMLNAKLPLSTIRDNHLDTTFAIVKNENTYLTKIYCSYNLKVVNAFGTWYELKTRTTTDLATLDMHPDLYSPELLLPSVNLETSLYCIVSYLWTNLA